MNTLRAGQPGATRTCPHCKATVLESASICPGCRHHLRFGSGTKLAEESYTALSVDGTIAHRESGIVCEYCIVLDIANERGEQVIRQVVGVGALQPGERRRLNVSVQMLPLVAQVLPRAQGTAAATLPAAAKAPMASGTLTSGSAAAQANPSGVNPARPALPTGPGASAATARPAAPAANGAPPLTPRPASAATSAPGTPRPAGAPQPPGGTASSQRLRIFRKP